MIWCLLSFFVSLHDADQNYVSRLVTLIKWKAVHDKVPCATGVYSADGEGLEPIDVESEHQRMLVFDKTFNVNISDFDI